MTTVNYIGYYYQYDGYGRYNSRIIQALQNQGIHVKAATMDSLSMPLWMQVQDGIDWDNLTISCLPPYYLKSVPGPHWLMSMVEGSVLPDEWVEKINNSGVELVIVPCQHNAYAFKNSGVVAPVHVIHGGTDPKEFPILGTNNSRPYTFLTIADRGMRKGWEEVWSAFYIAFGGKTTGKQDVRLIVKSLPKLGKTLSTVLAAADGADKRVFFDQSVPDSMVDVYREADCVVIPSRAEGWGMPHREAAMMGLPVITQKYSGLDDGYLQEWAMILKKGKVRPIPKEHKPSMGEWMIADKEELAEMMRWCYDNPTEAQNWGLRAAGWLKDNQTWEHSAKKMIGLMRKMGHG